MPDELSPFARELIMKCPWLINWVADRVNTWLNNWNPDDLDHKEKLEPVPLVVGSRTDIQELISHVGYDAAQCGYEK